ncbi:hypothetical protein DY000_02007750 [Brassica cretica]|uniref:Uncharacterized protein n=1 Tax=Brassica cretica TaxID=69181 RepID=A0ABQ7CCU0_BRACR|nr:hypothetical protein DY000_02007750 [Brassica cretica]
MIEDPMYVLLSFLGLSEEHPQPMGKVSLLKWLVKGNPENSLSEAIHLLLIDSPFEMLRNLFLSSPQGRDGFLSAFSRARYLSASTCQRWSSIDAR